MIAFGWILTAAIVVSAVWAAVIGNWILTGANLICLGIATVALRKNYQLRRKP